jgi:hypothetical protein
VPAEDGSNWKGYLILTGDLIEAGVPLSRITAEKCQIAFTVVPLGRGAQRVEMNVAGDPQALEADQRRLLLTFANGDSQPTTFRLTPLAPRGASRIGHELD